MPKGFMVLENGEVLSGELLGYTDKVIGEAVFNTSMNGYQEIITDPSYAGQILTLTYPNIGNYGFGEYGYQSAKPALSALVIKEMTDVNGHYESRWTFREFIARHNMTCLVGVDTRKLTRILRTEGSMGAVITDQVEVLSDLREEAVRGRKVMDSDLVSSVTCNNMETIGTGRNIVLWDFGCKNGIINELVSRGYKVTTVPAAAKSEDIMACNPCGVVLSNGPGNPQVCSYAVKEIKSIYKQLPVLGICLGHQLLAMAAGATTYKLKYGHRGANHTVKDLRNGKCSITSQNHGYAVEENSLRSTGFQVSYININDQTIEGIYHKELPVMSVQFHPEAAPGPQDTLNLFDEFLKMTE